MEIRLFSHSWCRCTAGWRYVGLTELIGDAGRSNFASSGDSRNRAARLTAGFLMLAVAPMAEHCDRRNAGKREVAPSDDRQSIPCRSQLPTRRASRVIVTIRDISSTVCLIVRCTKASLSRRQHLQHLEVTIFFDHPAGQVHRLYHAWFGAAIVFLKSHSSQGGRKLEKSFVIRHAHTLQENSLPIEMMSTGSKA